MKSVALLLPGGIFLLARVMARTKAKASGSKASKGAKSGKPKAPPAPPWWHPMTDLMEHNVSLWNVEGKGACGYLAFAFGKLQGHPLIQIPVVERDYWGKADVVPAAGQMLAPSSTWRIFEAFVRDAISAMASVVLRNAPHGLDVEPATLKGYLMWGS